MMPPLPPLPPHLLPNTFPHQRQRLVSVFHILFHFLLALNLTNLFATIRHILLSCQKILGQFLILCEMQISNSTVESSTSPRYNSSPTLRNFTSPPVNYTTQRRKPSAPDFAPNQNSQPPISSVPVSLYPHVTNPSHDVVTGLFLLILSYFKLI